MGMLYNIQYAYYIFAHYAKLKLCLDELITEEVGFEGGFEGRERVELPNALR